MTSKRDLDSLQQAVQRMREWMRAHPQDVYVGTALEELNILEEAARLVEEQKAQSITKAS
ncbi:MAG TPA: hypothetical protein VFB38_02525 [Chthonomonadaceae bacterium]|nr:hypothetical protein [Chthonomonadaceae bacterium]